MLHYHPNQFRLGALVAATLIALAANGSLLLGFEHLASQGEAACATTQTAVAQRDSSHVAL